jgi:glycosyltransferase involved in cell wall biosynthesis
LDFGPNVQALEWFCRHVWPRVKARVADARFTIIGMNPSIEVQALGRLPGVSLLANLEDLRPEANRSAVVVLPFVSGGGIKNKLLEAASLEKPIVCSPHACGGLRSGAPVIEHSTRQPERWAETIAALWADGSRRREMGIAARAWVLASHSWQAAARSVYSTLTTNGRQEKQ